jgi:hypothetical protein
MSGYTLTLHAYCGMAEPIGDNGMDQDDARQEAVKLLRRRRRQDFPIAVLKKGRRWEIQEPEDCMMVPDCCGVLILRDPGVRVPL